MSDEIQALTDIQFAIMWGESLLDQFDDAILRERELAGVDKDDDDE